MKKAFVVTSSIDVNNQYPLTYSKTRSFFSDDQRLEQTINTIHSIQASSDIDTDIFLVDTSRRCKNYSQKLSNIKNTKYISIDDIDPELYTIVTSHSNKSFCEINLLLSFFKKFNQELSIYDYFFKMSGRYSIDQNFKIESFTSDHTDKIFFKKPWEWDWKDHWNYQMVDLRDKQGDNTLKQYSTVLYGWGSKRFQDVLSLLTKSNDILSLPSMQHYDIETLSYFFSRSLSQYIVETDWVILGRLGHNGNLVRY
jgi:hypothetical protein